VALCRKLALLGAASVAIDGSKFKAVNARDKNFTEAKMKWRLLPPPLRWRCLAPTFWTFISIFCMPRWHYFAHRAVTRLHGRLDLPDILSFYGMFREMPLVAISNGQRSYWPQNWVGTVHQGLPRDLLPFESKAKILCVAPAPSI
jgi:hypothetical protein